jgi:hypothetical protein
MPGAVANAPVTPTRRLEVHGLSIAVCGAWDEVTGAVARDFTWFAAAAHGEPDLRVVLERRRPDLDGAGALTASFVTPRNVVYRDGPHTLIDYGGRALARHERGRFVVQSEDPQLAREAAHLFLLSAIGEHLDARGLPRLHALALASDRSALALLLPSGGGKSTLALRALRDPQVRLLSEDSPLLDTRGRLHPFPLPLGLSEADGAEARGPVRRVERMEFAPQLLLEVEAYADRVEREPRALTDLVIGRRSLGCEAHLERIGRRAAVQPLLREGVVGVGIYQGLEFLLGHGWRDLVARRRVAATRTRASAAALRQARVWRLTLGRDRERNWEVLRSLL